MALGKNIPKQKKGWGVAQVIEHLPSKCETLRLTPFPSSKKAKYRNQYSLEIQVYKLKIPTYIHSNKTDGMRMDVL
jgi:hypothetical protein